MAIRQHRVQCAPDYVAKLIILDLATTDAQHLLALAAAILALGAVYWLVRDQDRRERAWRNED